MSAIIHVKNGSFPLNRVVSRIFSFVSLEVSVSIQKPTSGVGFETKAETETLDGSIVLTVCYCLVQ